MKKIGLITFHASHNNGSMLQALALQTVLEKKYNCKVEIINFSNESQRNMYAVLPKADNYKRLIKNVIWMTKYKEMKKQYKSYCEFSGKYFHLSSKEYSLSSQLEELDGVYDAIIAGSDQVWNIACRDADDAYYLNFVQKTPKYAYAVSFGANNPFELGERNKYINYINKFRMISVREKNAQKWIADATGVKPKICLDPTMLLNENQWTNIVSIGEEPVISGEYIYYYCFSIDSKIKKFLRWISKIKKMPVYFMEAKEWTLKMCWKENIHLIGKYGPDVYINVVKNSSLFITTSFHGTAFATILKKNFWYINDGKPNKKDDRAVSFLTQLGLMNRYRTIEELKNVDLDVCPDYKEPYEKLKLLQEESFKYLDLLVKDCEKSEK